MTTAPQASDELERRLRDGDQSVFADVFTLHRQRLWQLVHFRMDHRIRSRVDVDDVVQEIYLAAESRLTNFIDGDFPSLFLWLRLVAGQTLSNVHRAHLRTESRAVSKETPNNAGAFTGTSVSLTQLFVAQVTSPSQVVAKEELVAQIRQCIDAMNEIDREVLALRHFEELSNQEVASVLEITPKTASIRYMRALERLRTILEKIE